ncbi:MAG: hypothetical protein ABIC95_04700 [archaeon]
MKDLSIKGVDGRHQYRWFSLVLISVLLIPSALAAFGDVSSDCCVFDGIGCSPLSAEQCTEGVYISGPCSGVSTCIPGCCIEQDGPESASCSVISTASCEGMFDPTLTAIEDCRSSYCDPMPPSAVVDSDRDGVIDEYDECPNDSPDTLVGNDGCPLDGLLFVPDPQDVDIPNDPESDTGMGCDQYTIEPDCATAGCDWTTFSSTDGYCCPGGMAYSRTQASCIPSCESKDQLHCVPLETFSENAQNYRRMSFPCQDTSLMCVSCALPGHCYSWDANQQQCEHNTADGEPACSDCVDNDEDTFTDYPLDSGCYSLTDPSELHENFQCDDGIDNDLDGNIDYPDDLGCSSPSDDDEEDTGDCDPSIDRPRDPGVSSTDRSVTLQWQQQSPYTAVFRSEFPDGPFSRLTVDPMEFDLQCETCSFTDHDVITGYTYYYHLLGAAGPQRDDMLGCTPTATVSARVSCGNDYLRCDFFNPRYCLCCQDAKDTIWEDQCVNQPCDVSSPVITFSDSFTDCNIPEKRFSYRPRGRHISRRTYFLLPMHATVTSATFDVEGVPDEGAPEEPESTEQSMVTQKAVGGTPENKGGNDNVRGID